MTNFVRYVIFVAQQQEKVKVFVLDENMFFVNDLFDRFGFIVNPIKMNSANS